MVLDMFNSIFLLIDIYRCVDQHSPSIRMAPSVWQHSLCSGLYSFPRQHCRSSVWNGNLRRHSYKRILIWINSPFRILATALVGREYVVFVQCIASGRIIAPETRFIASQSRQNDACNYLRVVKNGIPKKNMSHPY